jgi:hypothetical protein
LCVPLLLRKHFHHHYEWSSREAIHLRNIFQLGATTRNLW